jgi:hypothetical protein
MLDLIHVGNDGITELAALEKLLVALHQALKVVRHGLVGDRTVDALDDEVGSLAPAQVTEHHFTRENDTSGVDLIQARQANQQWHARTNNDRQQPLHHTLSNPAYFGAVPCVASKIA